MQSEQQCFGIFPIHRWVNHPGFDLPVRKLSLAHKRTSLVQTLEVSDMH